MPAIQRLECGPARRDAQNARSGRFQAQAQRLTYASIVVNHQRRPRRFGGGERAAGVLLSCVFHGRLIATHSQAFSHRVYCHSAPEKDS